MEGEDDNQPDAGAEGADEREELEEEERAALENGDPQVREWEAL